MDRKSLIDRRQIARFREIHDRLSIQHEEIKSLNDLEGDFYSLSHIVNQKMPRIDKIQTFSYISLAKRAPDHSYYHCVPCNVTFPTGSHLLRHRFNSTCWSTRESLHESKLKVYACRICDKVFTGYKPMIIHIITDFLTRGFTIPDENLDLSQCITIIYIEQLYSSDLETTLGKLKELIADSPDDIFDQIDQLEAEIDGEVEDYVSNDETLEFVIDLDQQKLAQESDSDPNAEADKPLLMSVSLNEFKNHRSFAVKEPSEKVRIIPINDPKNQKVQIEIVGMDEDYIDVRREIVSNDHGQASSDDSDRGEQLIQVLGKPKNKLIEARGSLHKALALKKTKQESLKSALIAKEKIKVKAPKNPTEKLKPSKSPPKKQKSELAKPPMVQIKQEPEIKSEPIEPCVLIDGDSAVKAAQAVMVVNFDKGQKPKQPKISKVPNIVKKPPRELKKEPKEPKEPSKKVPEKKIRASPKNLPPPREESKRRRTPKRKFAIEDSLDPDEIQHGDDDLYEYNDHRRSSQSENTFTVKQEPLISEPIVQIHEMEEAHSSIDTEEAKKISEAEEAELFSQLGTVVTLASNSRVKILQKAKLEIDELNDVSAELQKALHMEMARNQQLKSDLEGREKPPIKLIIQHGKTILQSEC